MDEKQNSKKVCTIIIFLDSCASASTLRKDIIEEYQKIIKQKKNKWYTMSPILR